MITILYIFKVFFYFKLIIINVIEINRYSGILKETARYLIKD